MLKPDYIHTYMYYTSLQYLCYNQITYIHVLHITPIPMLQPDYIYTYMYYIGVMCKTCMYVCNLVVA